MSQSKYYKVLRYATEQVKNLCLESINQNIIAIDNARNIYEQKTSDPDINISSEDRSKLVMVRVIVHDHTRNNPRQITQIHIHSVYYYDRLKKWQKIKTEQKEKLF